MSLTKDKLIQFEIVDDNKKEFENDKEMFNHNSNA